MKRTDILERKEEILQWIDECKPKCWIASQLQCKQSTLNNYLKEMDIEYAGQQSHPIANSNYIPVEQYIHTSAVKSTILRDKLIREHYKEDKCENCGLTEWQGQKIPLELHHKDKNHYNNELSNLIIICPNCHALFHYNNESSKVKEIKEKLNKCIDCRTPISAKATRCKSCAAKKNNPPTVDRPSREELKEMIYSLPFTTIGKEYGVTDNAVRKWCDQYKLPRTKTEIRSYSKEEWTKI